MHLFLLKFILVFSDHLSYVTDIIFNLGFSSPTQWYVRSDGSFLYHSTSKNYWKCWKRPIIFLMYSAVLLLTFHKYFWHLRRLLHGEDNTICFWKANQRHITLSLRFSLSMLYIIGYFYPSCWYHYIIVVVIVVVLDVPWELLLWRQIPCV